MTSLQERLLAASVTKQDAFIAGVNKALKTAAVFSAFEAFPSQKWLRWISGMGCKFEEVSQTFDRILDNII